MTAKDARAITNTHLKDANHFIKKIDELIVEAASKGEEYLMVVPVEELLEDKILGEVKNYYETNGFCFYLTEPLTGRYFLKIEW